MSVTFLRQNREFSERKGNSWSNQDIADFYRAVDILKQGGLNTEVDSGITDEGDPWFIFMRPETGDVVAHFAQIDGFFIAVSSLNQRIYKGRNIRVIVDQMLDSHPMLLPNTNNGGRLLLHPTAALTAFLAAAFILSIDGVKATTISDVIAMAGSQNTEQANSSTLIGSFNTRFDSFKGVFSDLTASNYNVAVLGAALIAHELSQNESNSINQVDLELGALGLNMLEGESAEASEDYFVVSSEPSRTPENKNDNSYSVNGVDYKIDAQETDNADAENGNIEGKKADQANLDATLDFSLVELPETSISVLGVNYEVFWSDEELVFKGLYQSNSQKKTHGDIFEAPGQLETAGQLETIGQLETGGLLDFRPDANSLDANLIALIENFQLAFQKTPSNFDSGNLLNFDNLGVTFDITGELKLVSLESSSFSDANVGLSKVPFMPADMFEPNANVVLFDNNTINDGSLTGDKVEIELEVNVDPLVQTKSILGHSLQNTSDVLHLSDAIDVVFYDGGNAEITGFELGTDLLWFFLSPKELSKAENSINHRGDLVLDFGDIGTLTFVGMVNDPYAELVV